MHSTDPTTSTGSSNSPPGSGPREPRIYGDLQTLTSLELHALPAELWQAALHAELLALRVGQIPSVLSPNSRAHYMTKAKVGKQVRRHAQLVGLNALGKATTAGSFMWKRPMAEAIVTVVVCKCRGVWSDPQNIIASLKHTIDGLEDAGVFVNDRGVQWGRVLTERRMVPTTWLIIEPKRQATNDELVKRCKKQWVRDPGWLRELYGQVVNVGGSK
jgi:hypothetical protein